LLQSTFVADDVSNIIKESIDAVLQNQQYNEAKVGAVTSGVLAERAQQGGPELGQGFEHCCNETFAVADQSMDQHVP
jgi:hypothetical protein